MRKKDAVAELLTKGDFVEIGLSHAQVCMEQGVSCYGIVV